MNAGLLAQLLPEGVDHYEVMNEIASYYGSSRSTPEDDVVFPNTDNYALRVTSESGQVTSINSGPAWTQNDLALLQARIDEKLVQSTGMGVEAAILFAIHPVEGSFGHESKIIQILPAPAEAPRPPQLIADHPFILEFSTRQSNSGSVTNNRRSRGILEWTWILNAVLRTNVKSMGPRTRQLWVITHDNREESRWGQEFYQVPGFVSRRDAFTALPEPSLPLIDSDRYYGADYRGSGNVLELPDSLSDTIISIMELSYPQRARFIRACQWIYAANALWQHHVSSTYIALVSAIESIANLQPNSHTCTECGSSHQWPGPTRLFQEFLEDNLSTELHLSGGKQELFRVRSKLSHGQSLLYYDAAPWDHTLSTTMLRDIHAMDSMHVVARNVLYNWVRAQG